MSGQEPCDTPAQESVFDACPERGTKNCLQFNILKQSVDIDLSCDA